MVKFSRKQYQFLADWIRNLPQPESTRVLLANNLSNELESTNPNYNSDRFLRVALASPSSKSEAENTD